MEYQELRLDRVSQIGTDRAIKVQKRQAKFFPLHAHEYYELEIILEGSGQQWINGQEQMVTRGAVSLLSPADFHEVRPDSGTVLWNIAFDESVLSGDILLAGFYQPFQLFPEKTVAKLDLAAQLLAESRTEQEIQPLMAYILLLVTQNSAQNQTVSGIQKAMRYVDTHFRDNPSLAQAAEQACLSPVYFGTLFRKVTGKTYVEYLNHRKVSCAKMLLRSGVSVTETCFSAGFGSLSGFLHAFRKITGMTPNDYREERRKKT